MSAANLLYEEVYPVVLDDTFAFYDESRLKNTLQWLARQDRQILIFTCQKREEEMLKKLGIPYHRIELKKERGQIC